MNVLLEFLTPGKILFVRVAILISRKTLVILSIYDSTRLFDLMCNIISKNYLLEILLDDWVKFRWLCSWNYCSQLKTFLRWLKFLSKGKTFLYYQCVLLLDSLTWCGLVLQWKYYFLEIIIDYWGKFRWLCS